MPITVVGVDCATRDAKVGLALAEEYPDGARLLDASIGSSKLRPVDRIVEWIDGRRPVVIALDAPLGWPAPLANQLAGHFAGSSVDTSASSLFRRFTDRYVEEVIGKRPLEVGADRIARTAVSALGLLADLREQLDDPIPLAWSETDLLPLSAIEVYPAATLRSRALKSEGYKGKKGHETRRELFESIAFDVAADLDLLEILANDNIFDGVICALAGLDFVKGRAIEPPDREIARKEGWIWFIKPGFGSAPGNRSDA